MTMMLRIHAQDESFILSEAGQPMEFESEGFARRVAKTLIAQETPENLRSVVGDLVQVYGEYPRVSLVEILSVEVVGRVEKS